MNVAGFSLSPIRCLGSGADCIIKTDRLIASKTSVHQRDARDGLGFDRPFGEGVEKGAQGKEIKTTSCFISSKVIGTHIQKHIFMYLKIYI